MVIKKSICKILSCAMAASLISGIAAEKDVVRAIATKNIISSWERARINQSVTKISEWIGKETTELLREQRFRCCSNQMDRCAFIMLCYCVYSSEMSRKERRLSELLSYRTKQELDSDFEFGRNISQLQYNGEKVTNIMNRVLNLNVDAEDLDKLGHVLVSLRDRCAKGASPKGKRDRYGKWNTGYAAEIREALKSNAYHYDYDDEYDDEE